MVEAEASLFEQRLSRNRFLRLIGTGAGLSLLPSSLAVLGAGPALGATSDILSDGRYPIGLWWPPPPKQTTAYRYKQIAEAGFNFVIGGNGVGNDEENAQALNAASANGLRFLPTDSKLRDIISGSSNRAAAATTPEAETPSLMRYLLEQDGPEPGSRSASEPGEQETTYYAAGAAEDEVRLRVKELLDLYGDNPALAGLNLYDEPGSGLFRILRIARQALQRRAPRELPYVNVWPSYASPSALGTATYEDYLDRYMRKFIHRSLASITTRSCRGMGSRETTSTTGRRSEGSRSSMASLRGSSSRAWASTPECPAFRIGAGPTRPRSGGRPT